MKRAFDILFVVVTSPLTLTVVALVAATAALFIGSPIFFKDLRAGKGGRAFRLVKFRTMRLGEGADAERLTRFGAFLRKTSLDELPELWNVLKGDMSLVGPRPLPIRYLPRYSTEQNRRHEVRPGLTGLAQVNGRNALDWETKFRYDIEYVDNRSLLMDIGILFRTVATVFSARGVSHAGEATMREFTGNAAE